MESNGLMYKITFYKCDRCGNQTMIPGLCNDCITILTDPNLNKPPSEIKKKTRRVCKKCGLEGCHHSRDYVIEVED